MRKSLIIMVLLVIISAILYWFKLSNDFVITLNTENFEKNNKVTATIKYIGKKDKIKIVHSGSGLIGFSIFHKESGFRVPMSMTFDERNDVLIKGETYIQEKEINDYLINKMVPGREYTVRASSIFEAEGIDTGDLSVSKVIKVDKKPE